MRREKNKLFEKIMYQNVAAALAFLLFSFALMYICTASSFRYAVNPWNDANAFFTVGKAMANGLVPYKDVFEQKGPLLYGIHALAYLISKNSFTGVYILESISIAVTGYFGYKLSNLYINKISSFLVSSFTLYFIVNSHCFYVGDSAEEFVLPMMMASIYFLMKFFKNSEENEMKWYHYFVSGIFTGCAAMIKFTLIGLWFGWMAVMMLYMLIIKKNFKGIVRGLLSFFSGVICAVIPWIVYFAANGAIRDFINVYFIVNATAYSSDETILEKAGHVFVIYYVRMKQHRVLMPVILASAILPAVFRRFSDGKVFSRIAVPALFLSCVFFVYFGGKSFSYYALPFTVFFIFVLIFVMSFADKIITKYQNSFIVKTTAALLAAAMIFASYSNNGTAAHTEKKLENTYNKKVSDYIQSHNPDGKILCYATLDMGCYLLDDYYDIQRHFESQNFEYEKYPENRDEQNRYINEHKVDYVITRTPKSDNGLGIVYNRNKKLRDDYELVLSEDFEIILQSNMRFTDSYTCYLFELKK